MNTGPGCALALLAHPDDAELLCAGTLALLAVRGWRIVITTATAGDCGSMTEDSEIIAAIRREETRVAAGCIGAEYHCLEERDLSIDYDSATRRKFTQELRRVQPTLVFTHPLADYMADHEIVGRLVRDACFAGPMVNYRTGSPDKVLPHIPHLYYCSAFQPENAGAGDSASTLVDISAVMGTKQQMLAQHSSQREWLRQQHGMDEYMRVQEEMARAIGAAAGCEFGERFCQHTGHPYPQSDLVAAAVDQARRPGS